MRSIHPKIPATRWVVVNPWDLGTHGFPQSHWLPRPCGPRRPHGHRGPHRRHGLWRTHGRRQRFEVVATPLTPKSPGGAATPCVPATRVRRHQRLAATTPTARGRRTLVPRRLTTTCARGTPWVVATLLRRRHGLRAHWAGRAPRRPLAGRARGGASTRRRSARAHAREVCVGVGRHAGGPGSHAVRKIALLLAGPGMAGSLAGPATAARRRPRLARRRPPGARRRLGGGAVPRALTLGPRRRGLAVQPVALRRRLLLAAAVGCALGPWAPASSNSCALEVCEWGQEGLLAPAGAHG